MSLSVKDIGVLFDAKLIFIKHYHSVVNEAYIRANVLLRCFHSRDRILQMKLFNRSARPILEYNSPVWSPYLIKVISSIAREQNFFTNGLKSFYNMCFIYTD